MRNTWAAYLVNIATGRIEWTLGGKDSSFKFGPGAAFQWQHDVALQPGSKVSLFDDHCCQLTGGGTYVSPTAPSRGLVLKLDQQTRTATLVAQYSLGNDFDAQYMGDTEPLPNGNVIVGWGSEPYFSEYSRSGKLLFEGELPGPDLTYRATLEPWVGQPLSPPAGAARQTDGRTTVYASWNGATEVASWRVLAGATAGGRMTAVASAARSGFETAIAVGQAYGSFRLQALDRRRTRDRNLPAVQLAGASMMVRATLAPAALASSSCSAHAAAPPRPTRRCSHERVAIRGAHRRRGQSGDGLAAAGNPRRLPGDTDQLSRRGRHAAWRTCASPARAAAPTRAFCAPTRPAPERASCPPARSVAGERVTVHARTGTQSAGVSEGEHDLHDRPRGPASARSEFPINPGDPAPSSTTAQRPRSRPRPSPSRRPRRPGATRRRSVPRPLPGRRAPPGR